MFKKSFVSVLLLAVGMMPCIADTGSSTFSGKRIAILHEKGKSPNDWSKMTLDISKKLVESGDVVSAEMVQDGKRAGLIYTATKCQDRFLRNYIPASV